MNKKLFSAALFGALLLGTASTFVSCKDYDDDIQNLQTQITANKDAIAQLQTLVGSGNWVSSINSIENGFVVNMSNGQSVTVTGINGKDGANGLDGKNGTEWTIGENGMWYKDGVVTEFKAVATDGKDGAAGAAGVSAPSPTIDANGMWVVYEYDAEAGKFVAKTTEISAQGTAAYAVQSAGSVELHIADETGKYQTITLPATSDSFVVTAPYESVKVILQEAKWTVSTDKNHKARLEKLTKAFPEIANFKKGDLMKQGGKLPVIVAPGTVELNDNFTFALQGVDGEVSEATLSNPVKGMGNLTFENTYSNIYKEEFDDGGNYVGDSYQGYTTTGKVLVSRAADANDCFWTIDVELAKNKKGDAYVSIYKPQTLVVANEKGTVAKTSFAYTVERTLPSNVKVYTSNNTKGYADAIDVFESDDEYGRLFYKYNDMNGKFIVEVEEPADVEKYGITVEGSKLMIANFPANESTICIRNVKVTVLGLNGSTYDAKQNIYIKKKIEASSELSAKTVTLNAKANAVGKYVNNVSWNVSELGMSAVELEKFMDSGRSVTLTWSDEDGNEQSCEYGLDAFDKDGKSTSDYKKVATVGFNFESKDLAPNEYDVLVKAGSLYAAATTLTVKNPTSTVISLFPELVSNDILQIVGTPGDDDFVTYNMPDGIKKSAIVDIVEFVDLDADEDDAATSWIESNGKTLKVYKNGVKVGDVTMKQLYTPRNFKVKYTLFGNDNNVEEMEFKGEVVSEIYNADPTAAITIDNTKLSAIFGGKDKTNIIDLKAAITKAIVAAGPDRGKTYSLFEKANADKVETTMDYSAPKAATNDNLLKGANFVEITEQAYIVALCKTYADNTKYYFTKEMWASVWSVAKTYYKTDGTAIKGADDKPLKVADVDATMVAIYNAYKGKIDFASSTTTTAQDPTPADYRLKSVKFTFADTTTAAKYVKSTSIGTSITAKDTIDEDIPNGKVELDVKLTIVDKWGMTMVRTFPVTLKTN